MKKVLAIILTVIMMTATAVVALADSVNPSGYTPDGTTATVKYVDKSVLKKDGVIGSDEYERLDIDVGEDTTILHAAFASAIALEDALNMLQYMEYYASWSDGQINIAVKSRPTEIKQVIPVETGEYPEDNFCKNTAFTVSSDTQQEREQGTVCNFYFAFALRTDTNEYQVGYYGADQRGNSESYLPVAGQDFAISYPGDGTAIFEISIPFSEICEGGAAEAGDSVYLSIGAEGGSGDTKDSDTSYSISLGDFTYYVSQRSAVNHAAFLLSDEAIESGNGGGDDTGNDTGDETGNETTGGGNTPSEGGNTPSEGGNTPSEGGSTPGNTTGGDSTPGNTTGGKTAPKTGDPMIVMAAVAALSAAGAFIVGKKRH